jgi:hypothetical protein
MEDGAGWESTGTPRAMEQTCGSTADRAVTASVAWLCSGGAASAFVLRVVCRPWVRARELLHPAIQSVGSDRTLASVA